MIGSQSMHTFPPEDPCTEHDVRPIVVTGFSRCGSTMMMRMLYEGGLEVYVDNRASFETPKITGLPDHSDWLKDTPSKAFKLLEPTRFVLPFDRQYRFIALSRDPEQQAASHSYFLRHLGAIPAPMTRNERRALAADLRKENAALPAWLSKHYPGSTVLPLAFEDILREPIVAAEKIRRSVCRELNPIFAAEAVLDRQPGATCDGLRIESASVTAEKYNYPLGVVWQRLKDQEANKP